MTCAPGIGGGSLGDNGDNGRERRQAESGATGDQGPAVLPPASRRAQPSRMSACTRQSRSDEIVGRSLNHRQHRRPSMAITVDNGISRETRAFASASRTVCSASKYQSFIVVLLMKSVSASRHCVALAEGQLASAWRAHAPVSLGFLRLVLIDGCDLVARISSLAWIAWVSRRFAPETKPPGRWRCPMV
jgi:hypothetical protein